MIEKNDPNRRKLCDKVIQTINEQNIKYIYLQFTDIHGILKSFEISSMDSFMDWSHSCVCFSSTIS